MARKKFEIEKKRRVVGNRPPIPASVVKSAGRVLRILEYFDEVQREASVVEICETLKYPQSSASALLRSLAILGYLHYDGAARTYLPTNRVTLLGNWINEKLFREGTLLRMMNELNQKTGDAVVLATRNGIHSQYIHVVQAKRLARLHVTLGSIRPLAASGTGYALLSTYSDAEVRKIVHRINAEATSQQMLVDVPNLLRVLEEVRKTGFAFTADLVTPGGAVIAAPLPMENLQQPLAVGLAGISEMHKKRKQELTEALLTAIRTFFG